MINEAIRNQPLSESSAFSIKPGFDLVRPNGAGIDPADTDPVKRYLREINTIKLLTAEEEIVLGGMVQAGISVNLRVLNREQIPAEELGRLQREAEAAKTKLIEANLRLVVSVAKRYRGRGLDFLDLVQEGNIGLAKAIDRFDPERGCRVSTFATWWIMQGITRAIADQAKIIRQPVHIQDQLKRLSQTERGLTQFLGRYPDPGEIAENLGTSAESIKELWTISQQPLSLDEQLTGEDEGYTWEDLIEDPDSISPEDSAVQAQFGHELGRGLEEIIEENLSGKEGIILRKRFGLRGERFHTLDEIGKKYGVSRERIR